MSSGFAKKVEKVENSGRGLAVGLALSCRRVSKNRPLGGRWPVGPEGESLTFVRNFRAYRKLSPTPPAGGAPSQRGPRSFSTVWDEPGSPASLAATFTFRVDDEHRPLHRRGGFHIRPGTFPLPQAAAGEHSSPLQTGIYTTISFSAIPTPYPSAHSPHSAPARETHYSSDSFAPRSCTHCPVWNLHRRERLYAGHAQNRPLQSR